jgi:ABC-type multidrug transport system ATPase subunit
MCCLVGFIPPTSGTAQVNGYDIRKDITSVRKSIGLCPQHNILFDTMTIEEHLHFFAKVSWRRAQFMFKELCPIFTLMTFLKLSICSLCTLYSEQLSDWVAFNTNFSSISAISWRFM